MSISKELTALAGVTEVQVDHTSGQARLTASDAVTQADLEHAISEAGYRATEFTNLP